MTDRMSAAETPVSERVNILIVDDRPDKLLALETVLAELGENVVCVGSGAAALRQLLERDFAVVLLDVNMPDMDGLETAALIRQRPRLRHVPIIFMTAGSDDTHALVGYSLGAVDYILTPIIPEILRTKIKVFVDLFKKTEELKRQTEQRVALAEERAARAAAEERSRRTAFLAEAGKAMSRSLDLESTVQVILDLLVPALADGAQLHISVPSGQDWSVGHGPVRPGFDRAVRGAVDRAVQSIATANITLPGGPGQDALTVGLVCPLLARGTVLGTLALTIDDSRARYDAIGVSLIEDLCGRAAIAIDNCVLYRDIQQRDLRKDEFVAMLAHELRNPLAALASALGVLELGESAETAAHARDVIGRQLKSLAQLADDLLDIARVTTGRITLSRSPVSLADSVTHCLSTFTAAGKTDGYTIDVQTHETWIDADPTRLDQVLMNLIGNAFKYTPRGGHIAIRVRPEDGMGVFEIEDDGVGMSPEVLAHAFELFFQADQALDRAKGGLGIGLALVRQLVHLHGGSVEAVSAGKERGSCFTVRFPRAEPATVREEVRAVRPEDRTRSRIVIVEDSRDAREMLRVLLGLSGHEVYEADDGPSAVETIRATEPDVALVDVGLPGFDGYEVARRVRAMRGPKDVFLVALTGYGQPEDKAAALEAGFDMHIVKPIDQNHLRAVIAEVQRRRGENSRHS